mmetsp:Transcript_14379/g.21844  ORF Transcript_14379/g.21844 Transcript_14379/m.21844 type:complete len:317 (-) Transcript_14379:125-1075(-)
MASSILTERPRKAIHTPRRCKRKDRSEWEKKEKASIGKRYRILSKIHSSLQGEVLLAEDIVNERKVVLKRSRNIGGFLGGRVSENPLNELKIMETIQKFGGHENIVEMLDSSSDEKHVCIVMPYYSRDLFSEMKDSGKMNEITARKVLRKILKAVAFLHSRGIAHLDLSLENLLVDDSGSKIKLCDFGAAHKINEGELLKNVLVGKLNYAAPEVLDNGTVPFDPFQADMYSIGATIMMMLIGHPLYDLENPNGKLAFQFATGGAKAVKQLLRAYGYTEGRGMPSENAIDLASKLLSANPKDRPSISQTMKHPWLSC